MHHKRFFLPIVVMVIMATAPTLGWGENTANGSAQTDTTQGNAVVSPEDLEIISNLDFVENLQLLNEEDFNMLEEADIGALEKSST